MAHVVPHVRQRQQAHCRDSCLRAPITGRREMSSSALHHSSQKQCYAARCNTMQRRAMSHNTMQCHAVHDGYRVQHTPKWPQSSRCYVRVNVCGNVTQNARCVPRCMSSPICLITPRPGEHGERPRQRQNAVSPCNVRTRRTPTCLITPRSGDCGELPHKTTGAAK